MRIPPKRLHFLFAGLALAVATAGQAHADPIIGGSTLITPAGFTQLESWLGQGDITLTKVFSHTAGDGKTSYNFHAAVDGLGATFTVIQLLATQGNQAQVIGGYNPQSWNSTNSYNITPTDAARTAFLFNLTNVAIQRQKLGTQAPVFFRDTRPTTAASTARRSARALICTLITRYRQDMVSIVAMEIRQAATISPGDRTGASPIPSTSARSRCSQSCRQASRPSPRPSPRP